jgi:hypothetical protein
LGAQQVLVKWDGGGETRKEVEITQGKEEWVKQLHEKFEDEGVKATPLEARTGEGGGGRESALLKNALDSHFGVVVGM